MQKRAVKKKFMAVEVIQSKIYLVRGHKVMIDQDLAEMYGVLTKNLNKAATRNIDRFPEDFMFQLTEKEADNLRFQIGTSSWGGRRYLPYAFTQEGVAMLSSALNSKRAVQVNIQIMRVFVRLRDLVMSHKSLVHKINDLERKVGEHDASIAHIFDQIRRLMGLPSQLGEGYKRTKIGFIVERPAPVQGRRRP